MSGTNAAKLAGAMTFSYVLTQHLVIALYALRIHSRVESDLHLALGLNWTRVFNLGKQR